MECKTGKKLSIDLLKKVNARKDNIVIYAPYTIGIDGNTLLESAVINTAGEMLTAGYNNEIFLDNGNMKVFSWNVNGVITCASAGKKSMVRMANFLSENFPLYDALYAIGKAEFWIERYEYHSERILSHSDNSDGKGGDAFECACRDCFIPNGKKYNRHAPEHTTDGRLNKALRGMLEEMLGE